MNIYLFLDRLYKFELSKDVFGSFSFDPDSSEESKLINVEAENDHWVLYETTDVKILFDGVPHSRTVLQPNCFYNLSRDNLQYLIYVEEVKFVDVHAYTFGPNLNLNIGNNENANVKLNSPFLIDKNISLSYDENKKLILDNPNGAFIYLNNSYVRDKSVFIRTGDQIQIFNFQFLILNNLLLIKADNAYLTVNMDSSGLANFNMPLPVNPKDLNIKDKDLYQRNDYFSKSPRIRRIIEKKVFKFSEAPKTDNKEMPLLLTLGPMFTMGIMSVFTLSDALNKLNTKQASWSELKLQILSAGTMLVSSLLWPLLTQFYNRVKNFLQKKKTRKKYKKYMDRKREEFEKERTLQKSILLENLISIDEICKRVKSKGHQLWDKRLDQEDLLVIRAGVGNEEMAAEFQYPDRDFEIDENDLRDMADKLVEEFKYINDVPIGYSLSEHKITDIMGDYNNSKKFVDGILLQLMTFYSYEDVKFVVFTNEKNKSNWDYLKYLNHCFTNDKSIRFFASDSDSSKVLADYFAQEVQFRLNLLSQNENFLRKPYYVIITDDYDAIKKFDFVKMITEIDVNLGYSFVILENRLGRLPSKCDNFINVSKEQSSILTNAFEKQKQVVFKSELNFDVDMMDIVKTLSNIPIEFEEGISELPDAINFLEMEKVGKVEQLNILNRWQNNDATQSLKAEVGVDENKEYIYLDLHEKFHGPHGLIAGTTGSGKSEFIITYILSLAMNYSPDDVSFILIDYKGGGLAYAFENKTNNIVLPHLAGTITNLDKAEMNRTLVSIDSEIKRRQKIFNIARDKCGESTIDIYKYQRLYNEGRIDEPCPHLFIICDEFAELKAQQPEFMQNLISVARIGRSLGVHLILATQKPSGVVDDQIWSNTKFRVCLKVADTADSNEMIKKPDAAAIKQAGRFYLQVGMDEIFVLGQSGWCGAKYYPSDKTLKQVDKSVNFINDYGVSIRSIQISANTQKVEAQGEQLAAIMNNIIDVSKKVGKKSRKLWLDNIPKVIELGNIIQKYSYSKKANEIILGEYDAPEKQEQGLLVYNLLEDGNTIIYGNDGSERENLIGTMFYSASLFYTPEEINFYLVDYGSEALRRFMALPHIGGMVFAGEDEKYSNLIKMIREEIAYRKKLFVDYGGEYSNYVNSTGNKLPLKVVIINGFDLLWEQDSAAYDLYPEIVKDSERYGIIFILSAGSTLANRVGSLLSNVYTFRLKDSSQYADVLGSKTKLTLSNTEGRGLVMHDVAHEFQTAAIKEDENELNEYLIQYIKDYKEKNLGYAKKIPTLPDVVSYDFIESEISNLNAVPIGVYRKDLDIVKYDFLANIGNLISANKVDATKSFVEDLIVLLRNMNINVMVFDPLSSLSVEKSQNVNYYNSNFSEILTKFKEYIDKLIETNANLSGSIIINGVDKFISKLDNSSDFDALVESLKKYEKFTLIVVDDKNKIKKYAYENWYQSVFVNTDGIWVGKGISDQNVYQLTNVDKSMNAPIKNNMGYVISEGYPALFKLIQFKEGDDKDE